MRPGHHHVVDAHHRVTPVAKTGLHCGLTQQMWARVVGPGDPGREDRAPLRPGPAGRWKAICACEHVTPVAKTGLHCGSIKVSGKPTITIP